VWNGPYACTCYHPLFMFNQFGDLERCTLRPVNVHSADGWVSVLKPAHRAVLGQSPAHLLPSRCSLRHAAFTSPGS
jgi:hypothetical protein